MSRKCLVSVATYGYLTMAYAMAKTFAAHNPDCEIILLVPDLRQAQIDAATWPSMPSARLIGLDVIGHPMIGMMHQYFDALELCCALKSYLMHHVLFAEGFDRVVMIDPDVLCFGQFDEVWGALDNSDVVLTPHVSAPLPLDGQKPDDMEFVTAGFINAGFMAARKSEGTKICLEWMMRTVPDFGFFAPEYHSYADQTLMSCLPWYFPNTVSVIRHAGLNVAYWNLHERRLAILDGKFFCSGQPLVFFHFSGFDTRQPQRLTKHTKREFNSDTNAVVSKLVENYDSELRQSGPGLPMIRPGAPCSKLFLSKRLKMFRKLRGRKASIDRRRFRDISIATLISSLSRMVRQFLQK